MNTMRNSLLLAASLALLAVSANAQAPMAKPLADFDKLMAQLKPSSVVGEPIRAGETTVIPFSAIRFRLGGLDAKAAFGGSGGGKVVPLGVVIVEGDDVRVERFPQPPEPPSLLREILQAILDRKLVFMGNGLNVGDFHGNIQELAPLVSGMLGQTTWIGNGLNMGSLKLPAAAASKPGTASLDELKKLFEANRFTDALAVADGLVAKEPKNAEPHVWKGRVMGSLAQGGPAEGMKYGMGAMQEFETAVALDPNNIDALIGRGVSRLRAPAGFGGNVDGAIADLEAANAKKASPEGYFYLGEAFKKKGENDKAAAAYKRALELRPNYAEATKALAGLH